MQFPEGGAFGGFEDVEAELVGLDRGEFRFEVFANGLAGEEGFPFFADLSFECESLDAVPAGF